MLKTPTRSPLRLLAISALVLLAVPALAQVPQDMTFTGRLVDDVGAPLVGPADLELEVYDAETDGTVLYYEKHMAVPLDATGGFSVQLGLGTNQSGTFDAALFSDPNRWLEVGVGPFVLTPRLIIGSVPWALVAEQSPVTGNGATGTTDLNLSEDMATAQIPGMSFTLTRKNAGSVFVLLTCNVRVRYDPGDRAQLTIRATGGGYVDTVVATGEIYHGVGFDVAGHQQAAVSAFLTPPAAGPITFTAHATAIDATGNSVAVLVGHRADQTLVAMEIQP